MGIKVPQVVIDLALSALMKIDFLPFVKTKIGALVLLISVWIEKLPLPEGTPPLPLAALEQVLQWLGTVLVLFGLVVWKARKKADDLGLPVPYILDSRRLHKEVLGD